MQTEIQKVLSSSNYQQYEVSAYSKPEKQCQHNLNYWQFGDYLAIGAGAHGKITKADGTIQRYWKQKQPKAYINTSASKDRLGEVKTINQQDLAFEFMVNNLRLKNGFSLETFTNTTGLKPTAIQAIIDQHIQNGLIEKKQFSYKPTEQCSVI